MAMTIPSGCSLAQQEHVPCCTTKTALEQLKEHIKETITVSKQPISTIHWSIRGDVPCRSRLIHRDPTLPLKKPKRPAASDQVEPVLRAPVYIITKVVLKLLQMMYNTYIFPFGFHQWFIGMIWHILVKQHYYSAWSILLFCPLSAIIQ